MPTLRERLDADLKDAMRAKDEVRTNAVRAVKSAIKYKEVEPGGGALDDGGILQIVMTLIKQRKDSLEQFTTGGRADLADKEAREISLLQAYLPAQLSPEELRAEVKAAIAEAKATGPKDMGAVMKIVTPKLKGRAEGKAISEEVKSQLASAGG